MATWVIVNGATVNQEGNAVTIAFWVRAGKDELPDPDHYNEYTVADPDDTDESLEASRKSGRIGQVKGCLFNSGSGLLSVIGSVLPITAAVVDLKVTYDTVGETATFTFKLWLELPASALVAVNNGALGDDPWATYVNGLADGWVTLCFKKPGGDKMAWSAAPVIDAADLHFEPTRAGSLPPDDLALALDAHAEWVQPPSGAKASLATWHDLTGVNDASGAGGVNRNLAGNDAGDPPRVNFENNDPPTNPARFTVAADPPVIGSQATIAAVFSADGNSAPATIVGRWNLDDGRAWRLFLGSGADAGKIVYQTFDGAAVDNAKFDIGEDDSTVLFVLSRNEDSTDNTRAWINGRPFEARTTATTVDTGGGPLSIGARKDAVGDWIEGFNGAIRQVVLYTAELDQYQVSLLSHIAAKRALVPLGTPIPIEWQTQPYSSETNENLPPERRLDRRPIAVVNLNSGKFTPNQFGQSAKWRPANQSKETVKSYLRSFIREALVGCDQFEVMFNRPAGKFVNDIPTSMITGVSNGEDCIQDFQWEAMREIWDEFGITHYNDDKAGLRRGWFYAGAGLPLNDHGQIVSTGYMANRVVGPIDAQTYLSGVLNQWLDADPGEGKQRFRCLFLDAAIHFYGKFVEVVHDESVFSEFTLVAEAIPQSGFDGEPPQPTVPLEYAARLGAPWFAQARNSNGPWWNLRNHLQTDKREGYNTRWEAGSWAVSPIYFGVLDNTYLDLVTLADVDVAALDFAAGNMTLGQVYTWCRKGVVPVAFYSQFAKVGAAWDYARGRIAVSRYANSPRICRVARA